MVWPLYWMVTSIIVIMGQHCVKCIQVGDVPHRLCMKNQCSVCIHNWCNGCSIYPLKYQNINHNITYDLFLYVSCQKTCLPSLISNSNLAKVLDLINPEVVTWFLWFDKTKNCPTLKSWVSNTKHQECVLIQQKQAHVKLTYIFFLNTKLQKWIERKVMNGIAFR